MSRSQYLRRILDALVEHGVLLVQDQRLPSVATLIAGEPVRGSWWAHPRAHDIYDVEHALREHPDVLMAKLVSGKDTFVQRSLWPALFAVATAREPWQRRGLSPLAKRLLALVQRDGSARTDEVPATGARKADKPGEAARELERRLLVHGDDVHTERGAHAKLLETWERWAKRAGARRGRTTAAQGKKQLEDAVAALNERFGAAGRLPWQTRASRR